MVENSCFHEWVHGLIPGQGTKIPQPMYSFFTDPTDSESRLCVTLTSFTSRPGLPGVEGGKEARRQGKSEEEKDR